MLAEGVLTSFFLFPEMELSSWFSHESHEMLSSPLNACSHTSARKPDLMSIAFSTIAGSKVTTTRKESSLLESPVVPHIILIESQVFRGYCVLS